MPTWLSVCPMCPMGSPWGRHGSPVPPRGFGGGPMKYLIKCVPLVVAICAVKLDAHFVQHGYHSRSRDICSTHPPTVIHFCVSIMQRAVYSSNGLMDVELGSASLTMRCASIDAQLFSLDAQRKLAAAAQRAEGQPQRLRSDLKQKRHPP